jgi:hypothetical protein
MAVVKLKCFTMTANSAGRLISSHYLQALLTKSEIELKLSQCKIQ